MPQEQGQENGRTSVLVYDDTLEVLDTVIGPEYTKRTGKGNPSRPEKVQLAVTLAREYIEQQKRRGSNE